MVFQPQKDDFLGAWRLQKAMTSLDGADLGRFEGNAQIFESETGRHYIYQETGQLFFGENSFHAERRYIWTFHDQDIEICFDDGRPFHWLNQTCEARHYCGQDIYDVEYRFQDFPTAWQSIWRITGPRKNTMIKNSYERF